MPDNKPKSLIFKMVPVEDIIPNDYNPNRMSAEAFAEYKAEVKRLGRLPKPAVVRPEGDKYRLIDGEHGWLAAKEAALSKIACEVLNVDLFESMRLTYKRNCGGENDPLALGLMFGAMMKERGLTQRGLSRATNIPEATVRSYLTYPKALELRTACAGEDRTEEIRGLTHDQIEMYLRLPADWRNTWLDAGGSLESLKAVRGNISQITGPISAAGLAYVIDSDMLRFRQSLRLAVELGEWRWAHRDIEQIDAYIRPLAELRVGRLGFYVPAEVMDLLPCEIRGDKVTALITPEVWETILRNAASHANDPRGLSALVQSGVRTALRKAGVDLSRVCGPEVAEAVQIIQGAPDFIRDADFLSLDEQMRLATATADASASVIQRAKEMSVEQLRINRTSAGNEKPLFTGSVDAIFKACLEHILREQPVAELDKLFADRVRLLEAVLAKVGASKSVNGNLVDGRPAAEVLAERLRAMEPPEFALLAAGLLGSPDPARRWIAVIDAGDVRAMRANHKQTPPKRPK